MIDGSALVEVAIRSPREVDVITAIGNNEIAAPSFIDAEVISTLRRLERLGSIRPDEALLAITILRATLIRRMPMRPLLDAIWALRFNFSAYDASYVALAQSLGCALVTADARMSRAPRLPVRIIVI